MEYEQRYHKQQVVLPRPNPKYECLLFDVDDTLYAPTWGFSEQCANNIIEYMRNKLGMEKSEVPHLCFQLYKDYGTTLAGLTALGYDVNYDDFHSFIHGSLPYEILKPDPLLKHLLLTLPYRKMVFSNANEAHVAIVLRLLGLEDCFERIICFETLNSNKNMSSHQTSSLNLATVDHNSGNSSDELAAPKSTSPVVICKPNEEAFQQACKIAGINPQTTLFIDDNLSNLQAAKRVGLHTVLIGSSHRTLGVDYALESIHNIREALPELWEALDLDLDLHLDIDNARESVCYSENTAIQTTLTA